MDNLNTLAEATLSTYQPRMSNVTSSPSNSRVIERTPRTITLPVSGQILHVSVEAPDLSVARVGERIREGGHDVPAEKIGKCFDQNGAFIKQVVMLSDVAHVELRPVFRTVCLLALRGHFPSHIFESLFWRFVADA